jgi:nicotinamidase-related amidase
MSKRAVLVVDLQNEYFPAGKLPLVGIDEAVANAARVIDGARTKGDPVIHVRHEFTAPDAPFFIPGTEGVRIHPAVAPVEGEPVVV